jgi:hypothetical protein
MAARHLDFLPVGFSPARLAGFGVLVLLPVLALRARHRRLALAGLVFAAMTFAPVLLPITTYRLLGERYLYLPIAGIALWLAALVPDRRLTLAVTAPCVVGALLLLHQRLPAWSNDVTLFAADARRDPTCYNSTQLANALLSQDRSREALDALDLVATRQPGCVAGLRLAVTTAALRGETARAVRYGQTASRGPLGRSPAFTGQLAWLLAALGRWDEALSLARPAAAALPGGQGAVVVAAAAWRTGDRATWEAQASSWRDLRAMEVWVARLLKRSGDLEGLAKLRDIGIDPTATVAGLQLEDPPAESAEEPR